MKFRLVENRNLMEDNNMPKFHMVFTVDGVKSEQDISAVNVQKAEELIRKQYNGQTLSFMSKQEIKDINEGYSKSDLYSALEYMYGFNKKEANDWIKKADDKIKQSVVDAFKDNAKKSFLTDSLHEDFDDMFEDEEDKEDTLIEIGRAILDDYTHGLTNGGHSWSLEIEDYDELSEYDLEEIADAITGDSVSGMTSNGVSWSLDIDSYFDESLNEDVEDPVAVKEDAVEESERVPQTENEVGLSNLIIQEINGEWETIQHYNDLIAVMRAQGYDDMIDVISDIVAEENTHIGQLQKCLQVISPNVSKIEAGETEAMEQLYTGEECLTCTDGTELCVDSDCDFVPDDDFGADSGFDIYLV